MMSKTFHGKVEETVDALIILEACRQGVMPRITRRLLAAERGETRPPPNPPSETSSSSSSSSTRMSSRLSESASASASASVATTTPFSSSSLSSATACSSSPALSSASATPSPTATVSSSSTMTNPSLIVPGSVFVFDEEESGICRWTDGKIWSPSRICGNFLVYRELYRKLPNQKCYTTSDKSKMKDGSGLKDQALKDKVDKENLVVMGCMKGTFVLKKGGLIKKTICVKGINLIPPEELKRRLEGPALGLSSSERRGGRVRGGRRGNGGTGRNLLPGFSTRGTQHLVCYEMPGEVDHLHSPREYLELRDLPISKTFVMMQSYRVPIQILPLDFGQQPLDPADEYIHSSRIFEARATKESTPLFSSNTAIEGPVKRRRTCGSRQRKRVEGKSSESDEKPDYLVNETKNSDGGAYNGSRMMTASRPILPPIAPPSPAVAPVYHNYSTRGQDRYIRKQVRQQLIEPWSPSPPTDSTSKGKERKMPSSRSLAIETEDTSTVKVEKSCPLIEFSYSGSRSTESGVFLKYGIGVGGEEMGEGQYGTAPEMPTSSLVTRNTPREMQELLQSMNTDHFQGDNELQVHGYKTAEGEWRLATSSRSTSSCSAANGTTAYARTKYNYGYDHPSSTYPYHGGPHWQQHDPSYSRQQQQRSWDFVANDQMNLRRTYSGLYPAQQHPIPYYEPQPQPQPQDESQYQTPQQQEAYSHESMAYFNAASASITMMPPMQDLQGHYNHHIGGGHYEQSFSLGSNTAPATTLDVGRYAADIAMERSDDAGYPPVQQPLARMERRDSPWSSESVYSRSSSLSTSLTLSPIVRTQASVGQDSDLSAVSGTENQPLTSVQIANEHRDDGGVHTLSDYSSYDDRPPCDRQPVTEQTQPSMTATSSNNQSQTVSVSFTHNARSSSSHTGSTSALIQAPATMAMPTPPFDLAHMVDYTVNPVSLTSVTPAVNNDHQIQRLSGPILQVSQQAHDPFHTSYRPFRRHSQSYVPVMSFSSETILGACAANSHQKSPVSLREEAMRSVASGSKPQGCLDLLKDGANEPPSQEQEQEQFATDEDNLDVEPFPSRIHVTPSSETSAQSSNEGPFTGDGTTIVTMITSPVQISSYSAAGPFRESVESSPLSHQPDSEPYSPQSHREYIHLPSFLFQDLDDQDELDRLLDYHSHQMDMLKHDEEEAVEVHVDDDRRLRETGGDNNQSSERTFHQTAPSLIDPLTESESQTLKESQLMSLGTLSALRYYSQKGPSSMRGSDSDPSAGREGPAAPCLSMVSSSGSLGQDEYLLHQARPHITKMHIRRYGHGTSSGTGVGTSLGVGLDSSDVCGYIPGSDDGSSSGRLKLSGPAAGSRAGAGTGTDSDGHYDRSQDLPWAMNRQENTTSSEIACQLFSELGPSRGRGGGEGHGYASGMGIGIGTAIGSSRDGSSVQLVGYSGGHGSGGGNEAVDGRTRSVQTLQLSDPAERYSFGDGQDESPSRSALSSSKQLQQEEEEQKEKSEYSPHQQLQVWQRGRGHVVNRLSDRSFIDKEEVEDEEEEEVEEEEVLGWCSEHSSERASPVLEFYDDDDGDDNEDMDQGYDGPALEGDVDFAEGLLSDQGDGGDGVNGAEMLEDLAGSQASTETEDPLPK